MQLLEIRHWSQRHESDCLVACAAMVLEHLGETVDYARLVRLLGTTAEGTYFPNIERIESLGFWVERGNYGSLQRFQQMIELGLPVIVGVTTFTWHHWGEEVTEHAVVVVGVGDDVIYIHDPAFDDAPIELSLLEFQIGWMEKDEAYAIIGLTAPD